MKQIKDMTNSELAVYCTDHNIHVKAKNQKPTKPEYLAAIKDAEYLATKKELTIDDIIDEEVVIGEGLSDEDAEELLNVDTPELDMSTKEESEESKKITRGQKRRKQYAENMNLNRVIITRNDPTQTYAQNQIDYITWGNRLLGHHTDRFIVGKPWHVRTGALNNLRGMVSRRSIQDDEGNTVKFESIPTWNINMLEPLTNAEIQKIAKKQTIREASIDALI